MTTAPEIMLWNMYKFFKILTFNTPTLDIRSCAPLKALTVLKSHQEIPALNYQ